MENVKLIKAAKPVMTNNARQHVSKHFDIVLAIDFHWTTIPLPPSFGFIPLPLPHLFIGMVFDPMDYLHFDIPIPSFLQEKIGAKSIPLGGSIYVHGRHKATTTTSVMGVLLPFRHISSIPGIYFIVNIPGSPHEGEVYWGSTTVLAQGSELSGSDPQQVLTCWCPPMGLKMLPTMPNKIKKNPLSYFAFYNDILSMYVQINTGGPVLVGGTFAPHNYTMTEMLMRFAGMALIKGLGKLAGALGKQALKGVNKLLQKAFGLTNPLSKRLCAFGLEPVNFVTGAMFFEWIDFELPGGTALKWGNIWRSDKPYTGMMGNGVYNSYDLYIIPDEEAGIAGFNHPKENMVMPLPYIKAGAMPYYDRSQRVWMERPDEQTWIITLDQDVYTYLRHAGTDGDIYRIHSIHYAEGTQLAFSYHRGSSLLATIKDNTGRALELECDEQQTHIVQVFYRYQTLRKLMVRYDYDEHNNLVRVTDIAGKALRFEYNSQNHIISRTNRNGISYCWTYDQEGRVIHTHGPEGYQEGRLNYFPELGYNEVHYNDGRVLSYHYDENDLLYKEVDAMGGETFYAYTRFNERRMVASPEGRLVGYDYDEQGNISVYHTPEGEQYQYAYDVMNRLIMRSEPSGLTESWTYEGLRKTQQVTKDGRIVRYHYDEATGLPAYCIDDKGRSLHWQYNGLRQTISETDGSGAGRSWQYDAYGRMMVFRPAPQQELRWRRDAMGRITHYKGPGQDEVVFAYDAYELPVYAADSKEEWQLEYTPMGNVRRQTRSSKTNARHTQELAFSYDNYEQLQSVTNEKGDRHTFGRDANNQVIEETGFDGLRQEYIRDRDGQLLKTVLPEGKSIYHNYDLSGRLVYNRYDDDFWEAFKYDRSGLLESADNPHASVQLRRNAQGQVVQEQQGDHTIDYTYDAFGNLTGLKSALGADVAMSYDNLGYLTGMQAQQDGQAWTAAIGRNEQGDELDRSMTGGLQSSFVYDHEGRPISQKITQDGHTHLHRQYSWNNNYKLATCLNLLTGGKITYDYDSRGDLAATTYDQKAPEYKTADDAGNVFRTAQQQDRVYGANGKLLRDNEWHYRYDALGRLILKSKRNVNDMPSGNMDQALSASQQWAWTTTDAAGPAGADPGTLSQLPDTAPDTPEWQQDDWLYTWYPDGMLQAVKDPRGRETRFEYDALGRRTAKIRDQRIRRYLWQGNQLLHEWEYDLSERPQLVVDSTGKLGPDRSEPVGTDLITWIYEGDSLTPVARLAGGQRHSIVSDYLGVPVMAFDEKGRKVWACTLDSYGCIRTLYGERSFIPFRYQGQYEDEETGLYYNRFRYYDCHTGTYISPDPIGLAGNNPTFYSYTHDPNIFFDPFGLTTFQKRLGDYGENWAKQQLSNNGKYKQVFHVQNASNNGIDLVGLRHDGKFDIFEVKTNMSGEVGKLSPRQADPAAFTRDVLGPNKAGNGSYGISPQMANRIKNNIGEYRLIDVWVQRGEKGRWYVEKAMVSDWTEIGKLYQ
ncbi:RHS repeat-associated core domain-containing protein [Taibaiella koreensis]|uniref:RHS repeat-associated core domain-containing protein n=1 Tax=Taibaiella koreensis TaxID=1268548 RepID=UPI0013C2F10D|nr:RHS repeat-associated core domain-containing protein [Taibaiella koreensis]